MIKALYRGDNMEQVAKKSGTTIQIAETFGLKASTLAVMRSKGKGPNYYKIGRKVIYFYKDVERWLKSFPNKTA